MTVSFDESVLLLEAKIQKDIENTICAFQIADKDAVVKK
jgi:hypothetical protein